MQIGMLRLERFPVQQMKENAFLICAAFCIRLTERIRFHMLTAQVHHQQQPYRTYPIVDNAVGFTSIRIATKRRKHL